MFSALILSFCAMFTIAHPPSSHPRACANALRNPSFESQTLDPWKVYATGSWASRAVVSGPAHDGTHFFAAISNSTNASTVTLSQSFSLFTSEVECEAWVMAVGDFGEKGSVRVEAFVDGVRCGGVDVGENRGWVKVGGRVRVQGGSHMVVVVGVVDGGGEIGKEIGIRVDGVRVKAC